MSQICQIHVEFHVAFVRFETKRNVVQDMTCMVSFDSIFHQECIYCGLWDQKQRFRTQIHRFQWGYQSSRGCQSQDTPTTDPWILYFFRSPKRCFCYVWWKYGPEMYPTPSDMKFCIEWCVWLVAGSGLKITWSITWYLARSTCICWKYESWLSRG